MTFHARMLALALSATPFSLAALAPLPASAADYSEGALRAAGAVTRAQAIAIAEAAVPGTKLIAAVFEKADHIPHWSVDLVGSTYEYEVWVSVGGSVLRIITQPK